MKRSWFAVMTALSLLVLAGCSDYPDSGVVDAREIRENATINEITGVVYGLKPEAEGAFLNYMADRESMGNFSDEVWSYVLAGSEGEKPSLAMAYKGADTSALQKEVPALFEAAQKAIDEKKAEYKAEVDKAKAELAEYQALDDQYTTSIEAYRADVAKAEADYAAMEAKLDAATEAYNQTFSGVSEALNALAKSKGLNVSYDGGNVIGRSRSIDFSKRSENPAQCPDQKGYMPVDIRAINGLCAYLPVPSELEQAGVSKQAQDIISEHFIAMQKATQTLGKKSSWGSKATGMYAAVKEAEQTLSDRKSAASEKHSVTQSMMYDVSYNKRRIEIATGSLKRLEGNDYVNSHFTPYGYWKTDGFQEETDNFVAAMEKDLFTTHIDRASVITLTAEGDVKNGAFKDVGSDYVGLIALTDVVATHRGSKDVARSISYVDLTEETVKKADLIEVKVTQDNTESRGRDGSEEKQDADAMDFLWDRLRNS